MRLDGLDRSAKISLMTRVLAALMAIAFAVASVALAVERTRAGAIDAAATYAAASFEAEAPAHTDCSGHTEVGGEARGGALCCSAAALHCMGLGAPPDVASSADPAAAPSSHASIGHEAGSGRHPGGETPPPRPTV